MTRKDLRTPEQQELDERIERAERREAHLNETLTRREVLDALESVASDYNGQHGHDTRDFLRRLAKALS